MKGTSLPPPDSPDDLKVHVTENIKAIKHTQFLQAHLNSQEGPGLSTLQQEGQAFEHYTRWVTSN